MELLFYNAVLYFWAVGMNNQLLRAPLSSISEAPTESSNAMVAICRHNLHATEGCIQKEPNSVSLPLFQRNCNSVENHMFQMESLQSQGPLVVFYLGVLLMGKKCKAVCMLSRHFLDWLTENFCGKWE